MNAEPILYQMTLMEWVRKGGIYLALIFLLFLVLKIVSKKKLPESTNFIPLLFGAAYISYKWVMYLSRDGLGHLDRFAVSTLKTLIVATSYTIILILVDSIKALLNLDRRKEK